MAKKLTPMMAQYQEIKAQYPDCLLFYRLGDFYEMFGDDAVEGSKLLDITLTARNKGDHKTPMCGMPYHSAAGYIAKLTKLGRKVAICEQVSDPSQPGIVQREVVRVVTPGTTLDQNILDYKSNNYAVAIEAKNNSYALAVSDVTTGEFYVTQLQGLSNLKAEITRLSPTECIVKPELQDKIREDLAEFTSLHSFPHDLLYPPAEILTKHFRVKNLESFGLSNNPQLTAAAARLLNYFQETQKTDLNHINSLRTYSLGDFMALDEATLRNLELFETIRDHTKEGSLFNVIDATVTPMGARRLKSWLLHPLVDLEQINDRLEAVAEFHQKTPLRDTLREAFKPVKDIERLVSRLTLQSGNARDLIGLRESLKALPAVKSIVDQTQSTRLQELHQSLDCCEDLVDILEKSIEEDPPATLRDGGMIKAGLHQELDELKAISREGKGFIQQLQQKEIERTGITSLKVKYNKVFGYYLEVSKSNLSAVPDDYIRKQTLVNAERFITPELKEYEEKVLGAEDKIKDLEYQLFQEIRQKIVDNAPRLQQVAKNISHFDVLSALAHTAIQNRYVKPEINEDQALEIQEGRHPVVEKMTFAGNFIPNDTYLDHESQQIALITGPNMGGKSTYLRQVALITLLAHIGSFVPAQSAKIPLVDRIFTRVGAADNLVKGQSTFMVEMQEAAHILHNATNKSLVILDEIGRGTSTYDGVSIAWAITEYLHHTIQAKTLFATHYHELISLAEKLPKAQNLSIAVKETAEQGVVFLYKILPGGVDKSYGIEVAKLAGLPNEVVSKSKEILTNLEEGVVEAGIRQQLDNTPQQSLFVEAGPTESRQHQPVVDDQAEKLKKEIEKIDVNNLTPIEALQKLNELKEV